MHHPCRLQTQLITGRTHEEGREVPLAQRHVAEQVRTASTASCARRPLSQYVPLQLRRHLSFSRCSLFHLKALAAIHASGYLHGDVRSLGLPAWRCAKR